ncbi:Hypothetical predicted protein [Olea europaea subsp. europaea]|uniref:Uncharacterized protein n=1 Tax=Olea europaea subsp. europaea TaxID=158383 RepID=A0A8S0TB74_OLEEU|nr:Hypothetical predicted protein [Olea europaea subsp. europaea]
MTITATSTYYNALRAVPKGHHMLDNVSFGAHILVFPSCERAASGAEPTQAVLLGGHWLEYHWSSTIVRRKLARAGMYRSLRLRSLKGYKPLVGSCSL